MRLKARRPGGRHAGPPAITIDENLGASETSAAIYDALEAPELEIECPDDADPMCPGCEARIGFRYELVEELMRQAFVGQPA